MNRKLFLLMFVALLYSFAGHSQALRYFEFKTECGHGRWQDSSFIAATSDTTVIDTIMADLAKPSDRRRMISGRLGHGNAGYNRNGDHWFTWHFIPNEWRLSEISMEVCDGCPYTDVDADTAYWISNIKYFCPWTSFILREVAAPAATSQPVKLSEIAIYPNPANNKLTITNTGGTNYTTTVYNTLFQPISVFSLSGKSHSIDISLFANGTYFLKLQTPDGVVMKSFVVLH